MSEVVVKYAKDHMPSILAIVIALVSAVTVVAQKNSDIETLKDGARVRTEAIRSLEAKTNDQLMILKRLEVNQEWIISKLKDKQ